MQEKTQFLEQGRMFGAYQVVRELGRGGMGAVYLVRDPSSGAELAAKVLYPAASAVDIMAVKRFIREAEIAMAVNHPNLIRVYDVGRDPDTGLGYMIMDYAPGGSLRDRLMQRLMRGDGPLPVRQALALVRQIAAALAAAAAHGIVHRDIKPDNILFAANGTPLLADLGVAKATNGEQTTTLTMENMVIGTPAYMAPEQLTDSRAVDARADVYSLGIMLWEMLVGERPNAGATTPELMARAIRLERIPDIQTRLPRAPRLVAALLRHMTEPDVDKRLAGPEEVIRFIADWNAHERRRFRRWLFGTMTAGAAAIALVTAGGIWYVRHELDASRRARAAKEAEHLPVTADEVSDAVEAVFAIPHHGS